MLLSSLKLVVVEYAYVNQFGIATTFTYGVDVACGVRI